MLESLRQYFTYTREFRIHSPDKTYTPGSFEDLSRSLKALINQQGSTAQDDGELLKITAEVGTTIWRLRRRISAGGESAELLGRFSRDLDAGEDFLRQGGIEIKDYTGEKYDGGMALKVIAFQPVPNLPCEKVMETIKPTIYFKNAILQIGQVIVAVPEKTNQ